MSTLEAVDALRARAVGTPDRRCFWRLWSLLAVVFLLTMAGRLGSGDGETMYQTTRALLTRAQLSIESRPEASQGRHGRYYGKYGLAQSATQAPFFLAGQRAGRLFGAVDDRPERFAVGATNSVVVATLAGVFWLLLRALDVRRGPAVAATLLLGLATPLWPYAREDFSEPLQATALLFAFYGLVRWRQHPICRWAALAGTAAGVAVLAKPAAAVLLPPLGLYFAVALWKHGFRRAAPHSIAAALPFAACALLQLALNYYRFGSPWDFGYGAEPATGFTTPVLDGIRFLLLSTGKGLLWFCPPALLGALLWLRLARHHGLEALVAALVFLFDLLYYARWWAWHGDWSWGPRYLVVTLPFLMLGWGVLFERWSRSPALVKLVAGALAALGCCAALLGVAVDYHSYYEVIAYQLGRGADVQEARTVREFSPLLGHFWLAKASLYDAVFGGSTDAARATVAHAAPNPFLRDYPWGQTHPELYPAEPERAVGFGFWFATREPRLPFVRFWSSIVACWLACSLVPLSIRLWRSANGLDVIRLPVTTVHAQETDLSPAFHSPAGEGRDITGVPSAVPPLLAGEGARG